jgi:dCTP deaminase
MFVVTAIFAIAGGLITIWSRRPLRAAIGLLIHISASFMQPGISNHQVLEMSNFGHLDLEILPNTPVCQFVFQRTEGTGQYEGIYQGQTPETFWKD